MLQPALVRAPRQLLLVALPTAIAKQWAAAWHATSYHVTPLRVPMRTGVVHVVPVRVIDQPSRRIATQYVVVGQSTAPHNEEEGAPAERQPPLTNSMRMLPRTARQRPGAGHVREDTMGAKRSGVGIGVNAFTGADHELPDITWNVPVLLTAMHHVVVGHARAAGHPT